ncbi:MATE family efflux transporter [Sphingobacterium psychroaquaticum]|uniref:hypothetical protein n=1 Tax=Sphingobacterium psychroaquaticum TaxID=561061 RepID=UPI00141B2853|nr:hypothetical protein [Sphingobacterium psychroaquaticum]
MRIGQSVILLPLILRFLPSDQISIWALFSSITALIAVFDLGFSNVFSRNVTQILSGSSYTLDKFKDNIESSNIRNISASDLMKTLTVMKRFYAYTSVVLFFSLSTFGTLYIYHIGKGVENKSQIYFSWAFLIGSTILNFFYNYLTIVLESKGLIKETQKITVYGILLSMVFAIVGVVCGGGLIAICASGFIAILFNRFFLYRLYEKEIRPLIPVEKVKFDFSAFKEIWSVTYRVSVASISSIAIYRSGIIIISLFLPLREAGIFAFSMNLVFMLSEVSFMYFYTHLPQINSMVYLSDKSGLKKVFTASILISSLSISCGGLVLVLFGNKLLELIGSNMSVMPPIPLSLVLLILLLDQIQNMSTFILFSEGNLSYMRPYAISAIIIISSTFILCWVLPSFYAVILPQLFTQLAFNYWFWVKKVFKNLEISLLDFKMVFPF